MTGQTCTLWVQQVPTLISAAGTSITINDTAPTADAYNLSLVEVRPTAVAPTITSLTPASGPIGTSVTIAGAGFGTTQGTSTVTFGGISATPTSWSNTSIVVPVPSGVALGSDSCGGFRTGCGNKQLRNFHGSLAAGSFPNNIAGPECQRLEQHECYGFLCLLRRRAAGAVSWTANSND